jgi:hypothetical protein
MPVTIVMVASLEALALRAVPEKLRLEERNQNVRNEMRKIQLRRVDKVVIRIHSSRHTSTLTAPQSSKAFCSFGTTKTSHTFALFHMQSRDLRGAREGSGRAGGKGNSGDRELHLSQRRQQKM